MVKSKPNNRAKGARRARRGPRKNIQKQNQNASKATRRNRRGGAQGEMDVRAPGPAGRMLNAEFPIVTKGVNYGGRWVERDELVAVIAGSVSFATTKFPINPGLPTTFPGLSKDAQLYSEWRVGSSRFYVKPLVSGYSTQGQTGETILSFDPNALNPAPTTQQQAEFLRHAQAAPYLEFALDLPVAEINRSDSKYIRTSAAPAGSDLKTYDGGNLYVSTYGQGGTATCCELRHASRFWVECPTLLNPSTAVGELQASGGSIAAATPFGAAPINVGAFSLAAAGTNVVSLSNLIIGDSYVVAAECTGTVITGMSIGTLVGLTSGGTGTANCFNSGATAACILYTFTATASNASFVLTVTASTVTSAHMAVSDAGPATIAVM
jgi:hypothetical protein